jgi:hypothetical protein
MVIRRVVSVVVVGALMMGVGVVARAAALENERAEVIAELQTLTQSVDRTQMRVDHLEGMIEVAEHDTADRAAVLEVRPAFLDQITAFGAVVSGAGDAVDTSAPLASALSAQQTVLAEHADPAVVVAATATVQALTQKIGEDVAAWQAEQSAGPGGPRWSSGGPEGYARVRAALDTVGGAGVGLYESSSCAGGTAPACANSNGYIKYRADIAGWSSERLEWAMAHELAHIYQFQVWGSLTSAGAYHSLFGGDPEFLANCMAVVRGYPGSVGCNADQQAWASGIWVGAVR